MLDLILRSSLSHTLLLVAPAACALLLRWARCPGWSVLGGAMAGLLLGPTILGRAAPESYEHVFVGGVEQRQALDALDRRHVADLLAAREAGIDPDSIEQMQRDHRLERAPIEAHLADARWSFQRPLRSYAAVVISLALLGAGFIGVPGGLAGQGLGAPLSIGSWAALLPGGAAFFIARGWFDAGWPDALLAAAGVAIGPWTLTPIDRSAADDAEQGGSQMVQAAGRIASAIAIVILLIGLGAGSGVSRLLWGLPVLALPLGWLLPVLSGAAAEADARRSRAPAVVRCVLEVAIVPSLVACVALHVDLHDDVAFWPLIVVCLLSGDGRWVGAVIGALLPGGRRLLRTMRLVLGATACGPTQLAVAAIIAMTGTGPHWLVASLLSGGVLIEVTTPLRRTAARRLIEAEDAAEALHRD